MAKRNKVQKKDKAKLLIILLLVVAVVFGCLAAMSWWENSQKNNVADSANDPVLQLKEITVDGQTYQQRRKVKSYLFIGVDMSGEATGVDSYIQGGQGDVQMLLTIDDLNRTWQILQLNRDSMVDVPVLGIQGNVVSSEFQQLCLAHSYGNGKELSCENNVNTVSALLDDQEIDGYFALNMDAIGLLNDLVGGVTVTVNADFTAVDPTLVEGQQVTLNADQAREFVRNRQNVGDETNLNRMSRQREFMNGFMNSIDGKDASFAKDIYNGLQDYTVTDLKEGTVSKIFTKIQKYTEKDILTIDGEQKVEDDHWAYYLDQDSLNKAIVELFYEKKEGE